MKALFDCRGKTIIRLNLIHKNGVSANLRAIEKVQERGTGRLQLISNIRMPRDTAVLRREIFIILPGVIIPVDKVNLWIALGSATSRVDMVSSKIATKVEGLLDRQVCKVLVSKGDNLALGDEESKLILAGGSEFAQLDAGDFGSDGGCELLDSRSFREKIFEGWVGVFTMIDVREWLERRILFAIVPDGQVVWILFTGLF